MRLIVVARRGSPVAHYAGWHHSTAEAFCGQLGLTAIDLHHPPGLTDPWWYGTPAQAADARILDRRRLCTSCIRTFEEWALEIDQALAIEEEKHDR